MGSTMVLPDGPPSVSRKIFSKPLKAHIKRSVTETLETERRDGSVMYKKLFIFPPPSILAASYSSPGIPCIPANRVIVINGRFFHTPIMVTVKRDIYLVVKNKIGFSIILSSMSTWLIRPNWRYDPGHQYDCPVYSASFHVHIQKSGDQHSQNIAKYDNRYGIDK